MKPTLIIMAAGMGSRFGGLKQIEPIGPSGEIIMDYSIFDAVRSGFGKVVIVIKKEIEEAFREKIGNKLEKIVETEYVFQEINNLPENFILPQARLKPWGTAHAILCCKDAVKTPFAVINGDDFYGSTTFKILSDFLTTNKNEDEYCLVGYDLYKTLSENGSVARGVCYTDENSYLNDIKERTKIFKINNKANFTTNEKDFFVLEEGTVVSMNSWGFMPKFFCELERIFIEFLSDTTTDLTKSEFYIANVVDSLIKNKKSQVKVLPSQESWYGVTYKEDMPFVVEGIKSLVDKNIYPNDLWRNFDYGKN